MRLSMSNTERGCRNGKRGLQKRGQNCLEKKSFFLSSSSLEESQHCFLLLFPSLSSCADVVCYPLCIPAQRFICASSISGQNSLRCEQQQTSCRRVRRKKKICWCQRIVLLLLLSKLLLPWLCGCLYLLAWRFTTSGSFLNWASATRSF